MKWKVTTGYGSSIFLLVAVTTSVAGGCGQSSNKQAHDPSDTDDTGKGGSTSTSNGDGDNNGTGDGDGDSSGTGDGDGDSTTDSTGSGTGGQVEPPPQADGWSDFASYLVTSDGSHALGTPGDTQITGRDSGTKIIFFDPEYGSNETGEPYYWDGERIVDKDGNAESGEGEEYGKDPFDPNLVAIKPMAFVDGVLENGQGDPRVRVTYHDFGQMAGGYPDWFLFRKGMTHTDFNLEFEGGRSPEEPMVVAGYGPSEDGRAIIEPDESSGGKHPLHVGPRNGESPISFHVVLAGLDIVDGITATGLNEAASVNEYGDPSNLFIEDCTLTRSSEGGSTRLTYLPQRTFIRRSAIGYVWNADSHNQGYYTAGGDAQTTFEEVVFYKNGYKTDPRLNADPVRDMFSRNVYEGGGAKMGHVYRNIISADGASGGPQMRLGGLIENSLIVEGYFFSGTNSNSTENPWATLQDGQSAVARNNVQLVLQYPSQGDPDSDGGSSNVAQPGAGYSVEGSSFGVVVEGNIISGAMQVNDLKSNQPQEGFGIGPGFDTYPDGNLYTMKGITFSKNIVYDMSVGLFLKEDWDGVAAVEVSENVFAASSADRVSAENLSSADQLLVDNNRFYVDQAPSDAAWVGDNNVVLAQADATSEEGWPDPDRTLRRYVEEVLNLELLDWADDPYLDPGQATDRAASDEEYDPTGTKTFMAVAMTMRNGGTVPIPSEGKPVIDGDYPWDERFTGAAVVSWIREGFGLPRVDED